MNLLRRLLQLIIEGEKLKHSIEIMLFEKGMLWLRD